jgi:hypothetical protein
VPSAPDRQICVQRGDPNGTYALMALDSTERRFCAPVGGLTAASFCAAKGRARRTRNGQYVRTEAIRPGGFTRAGHDDHVRRRNQAGGTVLG